MKRESKIPDKITVMGVPFRVEVVDCIDDKDPDQEPTWGQTVGSHRKIQLLSSQDTRRLWTTLVHEYIHACLYVVGVQMSDELEEVVAQTLEHGLEQFMLQHGEGFLKALEAMKE